MFTRISYAQDTLQLLLAVVHSLQRQCKPVLLATFGSERFATDLDSCSLLAESMVQSSLVQVEVIHCIAILALSCARKCSRHFAAWLLWEVVSSCCRAAGPDGGVGLCGKWQELHKIKTCSADRTERLHRAY